MSSARATYQGLPCQSAVYENPYGLASGHGYAVMPAKSLLARINGDPWSPLGRAVGTSARGGDALDGSIDVRGDLAFHFADSEPVILKDLYIGDAGIEWIKRSVEKSKNRGLVRVPFMDIRGLWATRGELAGSYNVLLSTDGVPKKAPKASTGDTDDRSGPAEGVAYDPDSLRPDGKPYTLTDMVRLCLSRLAGGVQLVGSARGLAAADAIIPTQIRLPDGALAVRVLSDLLAAWHFKPGLNLTTNKLTIWKRGDGMPNATWDGAVTTALDFSQTNDLAVSLRRVTRCTQKTQHYYPAKTVRIVGQPIVRERIRKLIAVGEWNGEIIPLANAAAKYGMTIDDLRRWVMLSTEAQENWKNGALSVEAIDAFRRWANKWFALEESERGVLPVLPYLARSTVDGVRRAPVINADTFDEIRIKRAELVANSEGAQLAHAALQAFDAVEKVDASKITPTEAPDSLELILKNLLGQSPEGATEASALQAALELDAKVEAQAHLDFVRARTIVLQKALSRAEQTEVTLANRSLATVNPSRYTVDKDGVVKFDFHVGWIDIWRYWERLPAELADRGVTTADLPMHTMVSLLDGARVLLLFAFEDKPAARAINLATFDKSRDIRFHYSFLAQKSGDKIVHLNPGGLEPEDTSALFTRRVATDLRCYVDVQGNTNRADLDAAALKIAERELDGADQFAGPEGEIIGYVPIETTGAVATVTWEMIGSGQKIRAHTRWTTGEAAHVDHKQPGRVKIAGTAGISTEPGSVTNPAVNRP